MTRIKQFIKKLLKKTLSVWLYVQLIELYRSPKKQIKKIIKLALLLIISKKNFEKLKKFITNISKQISDAYLSYRIKRAYKSHIKRIKQKVSKNKPIKVLFCTMYESSVWPFTSLIDEMKKDKNYSPFALCPESLIYNTKETRKKKQAETINFFSQRGVHCIKVKENQYFDTSPYDIIFYMCKHAEYIYPNKELKLTEAFKNLLTCYIPYGIMIFNWPDHQFNQPLHNLVWKSFCESKIHLKMIKKYAKNKGKNAIFSGYPKLDELFFEKKTKTSNIKTIIWAPHHTVDTGDTCNFSTFHIYKDFFLELVQKYTKINWILKPHPNLYEYCIEAKKFTKNELDLYFNNWQKQKNCSIYNQGEYNKLFLESTAMIHDSLSFIGEYFVTSKPQLILKNEHTTIDSFNDYGKEIYPLTYHAKNREEIINFIEEVVINNKDPLITKRNDFIQKHLIPPHNKSAAKNILDELNTTFGIKKNEK